VAPALTALCRGQAPALQEWFAGAENPVSRTWLQTVRTAPTVSVRLHHWILHIDSGRLPASHPKRCSACMDGKHIGSVLQVFFPLVPGVPTLLEPVEEQVGSLFCLSPFCLSALLQRYGVCTVTSRLI
jgi:hypothetical protein